MAELFKISGPTVTLIIRYLVLAGIPFLLLYFLWPSKFTKNKIQERIANNKDFIREFMHSIKTNLILGGIIALIVFTPLREFTQIYMDPSAYPTWWIPVSVLLAVIIHDTYFYWMHRTLHHPKLYKATHLMHHKSTNPTPLASFSFNAIESVTESLIFPIVVVLIPMHPLALVSFGVVSTIVNVYGHLGFEVAPKWLRHSFLFEIVNTSVHHNLHHEKFNGNYGYYFRVWDRIMGTENPDYVKMYDAVQARRFGSSAVVA